MTALFQSLRFAKQKIFELESQLKEREAELASLMQQIEQTDGLNGDRMTQREAEAVALAVGLAYLRILRDRGIHELSTIDPKRN